MKSTWSKPMALPKEPSIGSFVRNFLLYFPACICVDESGGRFFLSDSHHHRVIIFDESGKFLDSIGSSPGFEDGDFENAELLRPAGSFYQESDNSLYFVDSEICYHVLGLVHQIWTPIPRSMKNYIATPKPNGYQSLHTTVIPFLYESMFRLEVQIRTEEMDLIARRGIATHYCGKESGDGIAGKEVNGRSSRGKLVGIKDNISLRVVWHNSDTWCICLFSSGALEVV